MSDISTIPATKQIGPGETKTLVIDLTARLNAGETVSTSGLSASLTYQGQNGNVVVDYPAGLDGPPSVLNNILSQTVTNLITANRYKLLISFQIEPISSPPNIEQVELILLVV